MVSQERGRVFENFHICRIINPHLGRHEALSDTHGYQPTNNRGSALQACIGSSKFAREKYFSRTLRSAAVMLFGNN